MSELTALTAKLRALAKAATPGPWGPAYGDDPTHQAVKTFAKYEVGRYIAILDQNEGNKDADTIYIAALDPETVLKLVDTIDLLLARRSLFNRDGHCAVCGKGFLKKTPKQRICGERSCILRSRADAEARRSRGKKRPQTDKRRATQAAWREKNRERIRQQDKERRAALKASEGQPERGTP